MRTLLERPGRAPSCWLAELRILLYTILPDEPENRSGTENASDAEEQIEVLQRYFNKRKEILLRFCQITGRRLKSPLFPYEIRIRSNRVSTEKIFQVGCADRYVIAHARKAKRFMLIIS